GTEAQGRPNPLGLTPPRRATSEAPMIIVWGERFCGKIDKVPGLFYVTTRFAHVWYLPLVPLQSYIITGETEGGYRGLPIPLRLRSVLMAWGRTALIAVAVVAGVIALFEGLELASRPGRGDAVSFAVALAGAVASVALLVLSFV